MIFPESKSRAMMELEWFSGSTHLSVLEVGVVWLFCCPWHCRMRKGAEYKFPVAIYTWFLTLSMEGLLPHMAAPAYSPVLPPLSGSVKVCHKTAPFVAFNLKKLPRKVQHCWMLRPSSRDAVPT
ncbi:hypothetical protein PanWU01x14_336580 [Parasponia andersonii]|uniref:Uncharacterized protein n=1 Tax=Parasponia andersonii TaxID=3476 RepID=A0A2P5AFV9_PARAD|nr:hypothetical protein PanWU01x14_336580 [Parasponia andersonii]